MIKSTCPQGQWTQVLTGTTNIRVLLTNPYPDPVTLNVWKIHWGLTPPAVDTDNYIIYSFGENEYTKGVDIVALNSMNVYLMPLYADGIAYTGA